MGNSLRSAGLDVGTTSTQLIFSELEVENRAGSFSVPQLEIGSRKILYRSPVYFTPLQGENLVDGAALREIVAAEYAKAGIRPEDLDTGAVIITGETSRRENAAEVLRELSEFAGDFVVATAGPDLESLLAARGAGAVAYSEETGKTVLHMDIGGGTANLALIRRGQVEQTGCLNVGGRLIKYDKTHTITYISPVLKSLCSLTLGQRIREADLGNVSELLVHALEMAAGRREPGPLLTALTTAGTAMTPPAEPVTVSFSGGVADCIDKTLPWDEFGDLGPTLGQYIRESRLCREDYVLGKETIRATVIGAGCHSAHLSGSTVFYRGVAFPMQNLPVVRVPEGPISVDALDREIQKQDTNPVLCLPRQSCPDYGSICRLADALAALPGNAPLLLCTPGDMAKALGQALALRTGRGILSIDGIDPGAGSFLDVGAPIGPALPVVIKTIVLGS